MYSIIWYSYTLWKNSHNQVNMSTTLYIYIFLVFTCFVWTFSYFSYWIVISILQNSVLICSHHVIHILHDILRIYSSCNRKSVSFYSPLLISPSKILSTLCFNEFNFFKIPYKGEYTAFVFTLSDLFHLT